MPSGNDFDDVGMRAQESSVVFGRKGPLMRQMAAYKAIFYVRYTTAMVSNDLIPKKRLQTFLMLNIQKK